MLKMHLIIQPNMFLCLMNDFFLIIPRYHLFFFGNELNHEKDASRKRYKNNSHLPRCSIILRPVTICLYIK